MRKKIAELNFSIFQWILIIFRFMMFSWLLILTLFMHWLLEMLSSFFPFVIWKRYLSSILNLILNRLILIVLGYFQFDSQNFAFFNRNSQKLILRSGFIGIGTHKNIIDFFYYSFLMNPVFIKIILTVEKIKYNQTESQVIKDVAYAPLNYIQALKCALLYRGFDPIVIRSDSQYRKTKFRKMNMKTLVSQCFQQLKGPIFIMLPGLNHHQHVQLQNKIALDIFQNQAKFVRSGVGFKIQFSKNQKIFNYTYKNQLDLILNLMGQVRFNKLSVTALTFRNFRNNYRRQTYRDFIDNNFYLTPAQQIRSKQISYLQYLQQMNDQEQKAQQKKMHSKIE